MQERGDNDPLVIEQHIEALNFVRTGGQITPKKQESAAVRLHVPQLEVDGTLASSRIRRRERIQRAALDDCEAAITPYRAGQFFDQEFCKRRCRPKPMPQALE